MISGFLITSSSYSFFFANAVSASPHRLLAYWLVSVQDYGETYPFSVRGQTILLDSCSLAAALARLPEQTQEEIFLYYFQHLTQKEIGEQSGWTRSTIGRHIRLALKRLKEEMEVLSHE